MKKYLLLTMILFSLMQGINGQTEKKTLSYKEIIKLNKSLKGSVFWYLFIWVDGHYSVDLEFTTDVNIFFDFNRNEVMFIPIKIQQILHNNRQSFQLDRKDSSLTVYYDGQFIMYFENNLYCESISERLRDMVRMYDEKDVAIWSEELEGLFREKIVQIYKKYNKEDYETVLFPIDTTYYVAASNRPLMIAYQYEKKQGLSIHKLCSCKHELLHSQYTQDLAALANEYCEKYNLSKIIFAARVLKNKDD